jgi:hypothetical protein
MDTLVIEVALLLQVYKFSVTTDTHRSRSPSLAQSLFCKSLTLPLHTDYRQTSTRAWYQKSYDKLSMIGAKHAAASGAVGDSTNIFELDMDFEFNSPKGEATTNAPEQVQHAAPTVSLANHESMEVETRDVESTRQEHPNDANRINEQARSTASRSIRAHQPRYNPNQRPSRYSRRAHPFTAYRDSDDSRRRAYRYDRQYQNAPPDTLQNRTEATFVSAMADLDVKDEREGRRDGDRYRGGGYNKRRRDGKLASKSPECLRDTDSRV